jgi:hypothetical protein
VPYEILFSCILQNFHWRARQDLLPFLLLVVLVRNRLSCNTHLLELPLIFLLPFSSNSSYEPAVLLLVALKRSEDPAPSGKRLAPGGVALLERGSCLLG